MRRVDTWLLVIGVTAPILMTGCGQSPRDPRTKMADVHDALLAQQLDTLLREHQQSGLLSHAHAGPIAPTRRSQRDRIAKGATKQEVLDELGSPLLTAGRDSGHKYEVMFFCVDISEEGVPTEQVMEAAYRTMFWPVVFESDHVLGGGWPCFDHHLAQHQDSDQPDLETILAMLARARPCEKRD